jgi:hypothetical protein
MLHILLGCLDFLVLDILPFHCNSQHDIKTCLMVEPFILELLNLVKLTNNCKKLVLVWPMTRIKICEEAPS